MTAIPIPDLAELPAFMGYKADPRGGFIMRICCYGCKGRKEVEQLARMRGMAVSHGACPQCAAVYIARLTGAAV